ncbi:MAG: hypothetical protein M3Z20_15275 [Chloroflexota bacterium]|nr:hypothetical protein [Chloroflexota bacterium]
MTDTTRDMISPIPASDSFHLGCSRRTVVASLLATTALVFADLRQLHAQASTPPSGSVEVTPESAALLPRDVILTVEAVQEVIPEIAGEIATGPNATVMGTPVANRAVLFATADGAHRIVLSVDEYRSADDASRYFNEALEASRDVPGVTTEAVPDLGDAALIGVVTQGDETHVGGGALFGTLIVNATLQAFEGTDENKAKVAELIRKQAEHAAMALGLAAATPTGSS